MRQSCLIWTFTARSGFSENRKLRKPQHAVRWPDPRRFSERLRSPARNLRSARLIARPALIPGFFLLFALAFNCASASGGFSVSNVPVESRRFEVIAPGEEVALSWWSVDLGVIGLPLSEPPVARAERQLLSRAGGDALINLRYWNDRSVFLFFVNRQRFHLKADVVRFTDRK